jgi:hypothetical protein
MDEHPGNQRIPLTLNKYLYANADPVNNTDPSGHMEFSLGGVMTGLNNLSISIAVRVTLLGGRLAAQYPMLAGATGFVASILMPIEMQLAAGQARLGPVANASFSALWTNARQLSSVAAQFKNNANFIGKGDNVEAFIAATLNIKKYDGPYITVPFGRFKPDFSWGGGWLEAKTSVGAIKKEQFLKYLQWMQREEKPVIYFFFKRPSQSELSKLEQYAVDFLGPNVRLPQIAYIFE